MHVLNSGFRTLVATALVFIALAGTVSSGLGQDAPAEMTPVDVVEQVAPAVVTVINQQTVQSGMEAGQDVPAGAGTGFIIDEEGHIVTNWHVVTGGTSFVVVLSDGTQVDAELIGEDPRDDLAVVKIDPSAVTGVVGLGDSDSLQPGQSVLAIGSPLGAFGNTVTAGIISALGRDQFQQSQLDPRCQNYTDLIQHDAAINPGNSGGPLFNLQGEVVGVNTLGIPTSGGGAPVQGLFFAVPSSTVATVVEQLLSQGFISTPYIGINQVSINPQVASVNDLPVDSGVFISDVLAGMAAEEAGLQTGDIITSIGDMKVTQERTLSSILFDYAPGDTVDFTILRDGEQQTLSLTFGETPEEAFRQCALNN